MKKILLFTLVLFTLLIVLFFITLLTSKKKAAVGINPTPTPIAPLLPGFSSSPSIFPTLTENGGTTTINGVKMNNFSQNTPSINPQGDRTLTESDGYRITYLAGDKQFLIIITGSGFDANRHAAEQQFLTALGVSQSDACKLNVVERTISSANPDQAGQDYSLSFCGNEATNSTTPTAQPTPEKITIYKTTQSVDLAIGNAVLQGVFTQVAQAITSRLSQSGGALFDQFAGHPRGIPATMTLPSSVQLLYPSYRVVLRQGSNIGPAWRYWCTDLIIDTYNLAFGKRVLGEDLGAVQGQAAFWQREGNGFVFAHYSVNHQGALQQLFSTSPSFGGPIFWETDEGTYNGFAHVGLIQNGRLDSHGNGEIDTYEANAGSTIGKYPIVNWQVRNVPFPVVGFGLYTGKVR